MNIISMTEYGSGKACNPSLHSKVGSMDAKSLYSGIAVLTAIGLGVGTFLVTAKPSYGAIGAVAGLLIGSQLHSESALGA